MNMYRKSLGALALIALGIGVNTAHANCVTRTIEAYTVYVQYVGADLRIYSKLISMEGGRYTATARATVCHGLNKARQARLIAAQAAANYLADNIRNVQQGTEEFHRFFCAQKDHDFLVQQSLMMPFYAIAYTGLVLPDSKSSAWYEVPAPTACQF